MRDYDYLTVIYACTEDAVRYTEDQKVYDAVKTLYEDGKYKEICDMLSEWDYGEDSSNIEQELDEYDRVIYEDEIHILTHVDPIHWPCSDAFFLYRKDKRK